MSNDDEEREKHMKSLQRRVRKPSPEWVKRMAEDLGEQKSFRAPDGERYNLSPRVIMAIGGRFARFILSDEYQKRISRLSIESRRLPDGSFPQRGKIDSFSRASRLRFLDVLNQLDRRQITGRTIISHVTFPPIMHLGAKRSKSRIRSLIKRVRRNVCDQAVAIWHMHPAEDDVRRPHFHVLFWFPQDAMMKIESFESIVEFIKNEWGKITRNKKGAWIYGCNSRILDTPEAVATAIAYMGQSRFGEVDNPGRWWGKEGQLPITLVSVPIRPSMTFPLRRSINRHRKSPANPHPMNMRFYMKPETRQRLIGWVAMPQYRPNEMETLDNEDPLPNSFDPMLDEDAPYEQMENIIDNHDVDDEPRKEP